MLFRSVLQKMLHCYHAKLALAKDSYNQPTMSLAFEITTKCNSERSKQCTDAAPRYLANEKVSFIKVEKRAFKVMLQISDKQYELPGRKFFLKTTVPKLYNIRANISAMLNDVEYLALTTDVVQL